MANIEKVKKNVGVIKSSSVKKEKKTLTVNPIITNFRQDAGKLLNDHQKKSKEGVHVMKLVKSSGPEAIGD